jgi:acetyltransferase-like isoleucine patch superfamily enzyme
VSIGSGVKIQNGVSVYRGVTIESDCFIGPHAVFTNDLVPRAFNTNFVITNTLVCKGASIGANATIVCGVTLGKYCMIAAGSLVTKDIEEHALVLGSPAIHHSYICKCGFKIKNKEAMSCSSCS